MGHHFLGVFSAVEPTEVLACFPEGVVDIPASCVIKGVQGRIHPPPAEKPVALLNYIGQSATRGSSFNYSRFHKS